ncbi:MAG: hypothetical protein ACLFQV_10670 [Vulcanimicrobiota bacterium]
MKKYFYLFYIIVISILLIQPVPANYEEDYKELDSHKRVIEDAKYILETETTPEETRLQIYANLRQAYTYTQKGNWKEGFNKLINSGNKIFGLFSNDIEEAKKAGQANTPEMDMVAESFMDRAEELYYLYLETCYLTGIQALIMKKYDTAKLYFGVFTTKPFDFKNPKMEKGYRLLRTLAFIKLGEVDKNLPKTKP